MKIHFRLAWLASGSFGPKAFKSAAAYALFVDYAERISKFTPCGVSGFKDPSAKEPGRKLWLCDRAPGAKTLSSEEVAALLDRQRESGVRELDVAIGGPDGFSREAIETMKPDLRWCFGPLTLPHELAAVVAGEQIYRAWAIIRNLPYHSGH
jgi:23S rRNA (pseudouridine1915-N3)-methyltransferase